MTDAPAPLDDPGTDPFTVADRAAEIIRERTHVARHDFALVLGSGWGGTTTRLGTTRAMIDVTELPGFEPPAADGHAGTVRSVDVDGTDTHVLVLGGRTHLYEGRGVRAVVHGVRTAAAAGCRTVILTNGAGGLDPAWSPGTPVLISDHINLTATSPVEGASFVDLTDLYTARLRGIARTVDPTLAEGVYVQFRGPNYETPAEVAMAGRLGGHLVGMSTALEAIAARERGLDVLALSLVTNSAAGVSATPLDHAEVLAAGRAATERCATLLSGIVTAMATG